MPRVEDPWARALAACEAGNQKYGIDEKTRKRLARGVRRGSPRPRASLLDHVRLPDGRLAWPLAKALGVAEATFRSRLKIGYTPSEATFAPVKKQRRMRRASTPPESAENT